MLFEYLVSKPLILILDLLNIPSTNYYSERPFEHGKKFTGGVTS